MNIYVAIPEDPSLSMALTTPQHEKKFTSIDGSLLENISDSPSLNSRRTSLPLIHSHKMESLPSSNSRSASTLSNDTSILMNSQSLTSEKPRRSKFKNNRRAPPKPLELKRLSIMSAMSSNLSSPPLSPSSYLSSPNSIIYPITPPPDAGSPKRTLHLTLPRLTIPKNRRPPVQIIVTKPDSETTPPTTPKQLACNILIPLDFNFPDLTYIGSSPESNDLQDSPILLDDYDQQMTRSVFIEDDSTNIIYQDMENTSEKTEQSGNEGNVESSHNQILMKSIFQLLRSPTTASSTDSDFLPNTITTNSGTSLSSRRSTKPLPARDNVATTSITNAAAASIHPLLRKTPSLPRLTCDSCQESLPLNAFPSLPTSYCVHNSTTCSHCLVNWIQAYVKVGRIAGIKCPDATCRQTLNEQEVLHRIRRFPHIRREYDRVAETHDPNFRWCLKKTCRSGQIHEKEKGAFMRCRHCHFKQCVNHGIEWHFGYTCQGYDDIQKRSTLNASEQLIALTNNSRHT